MVPPAIALHVGFWRFLAAWAVYSAVTGYILVQVRCPGAAILMLLLLAHCCQRGDALPRSIVSLLGDAPLHLVPGVQPSDATAAAVAAPPLQPLVRLMS